MARRLAWLTDIHLNFLSPSEAEAFYQSVRDANTDAVLVGGDIAESDNFADHLRAMAKVVARPVYFVLGNHDFYRGSIREVRAQAAALACDGGEVHWLPECGVVSLSPTTALIGHGCWNDARLGDYDASDIRLNDYMLIREMCTLDKALRRRKLEQLGDQAADHVRAALTEALASHQRVIALTHVPPFREACRFEGRITSDRWLPHLACKAAGDVMVQIMREHDDRELTVLCGHTHSHADVSILPNLHVRTGAATYRKPVIQRVIEVS